MCQIRILSHEYLEFLNNLYMNDIEFSKLILFQVSTLENEVSLSSMMVVYSPPTQVSLYNFELIISTKYC